MNTHAPIFEYNDDGKCIYYKNNTGLEQWYEYDSNRNLIYYRNSIGTQEWYDTKGNLIHYRDSGGYEYWREYDTNGNSTYFKDNEGVEHWYDSEGNIVKKPTEKKDNDTMIDAQNDKLFIVKVKTTDTNTDGVWYDYEPIYANDAEQALYFWNEEMIETDTRHLYVVAVEVFSTQSVMIIDDENIDEEHSDG